jgi:hypothetical protein
MLLMLAFTLCVQLVNQHRIKVAFKAGTACMRSLACTGRVSLHAESFRVLFHMGQQQMPAPCIGGQQGMVVGGGGMRFTWSSRAAGDDCAVCCWTAGLG